VNIRKSPFWVNSALALVVLLIAQGWSQISELGFPRMV
jgi:hypothetical protein